MGRQLFGTDGIRGVAGEYPLDKRTVYAVGIALGEWAVGIHGADTEIVVGMDTRESGTWIAGHVAAGVMSRGARVRFAGLITTPGVAYLTRSRDYVAGVMISASHNPYQDNGIKVFDHSGFKLPDAQEQEIEKRIFALLQDGAEPASAPLEVDASLAAAYVDYLASTVGVRLDGMRLVLDCANGASVNLAPELFRRLGAEVVAIGCSPDGRNINLNCGALHIEALRERVLAERATAGIAFDGDADRCIMVSGGGRTVDGDAVLLLVADSLSRTGKLADARGELTVVATVMSNFGLEAALKARGVQLVRAAVGDKYVLEEMIRRGAHVGGEQSGHVIFRDYATTGDGMLTALRALEVAVESGQSFDTLTADLKVYPQILVNVKIKQKKPLEQIPAVQEEINAAMTDFGGAGRVVVRFSGTEPLARVMVEGPDDDRVKHFAAKIAKAVEVELGK